jgi:N-acetyltransferase 10
MDLVPTIARLYFIKDIIPASALSLSYLQATILIAIGLQHKPIESLESDLNLQSNQLLAQFNKAIRKFTRLFKQVFELDIGKKLDAESKHKVQQAAKALNQMQTGLKGKMTDEL